MNGRAGVVLAAALLLVGSKARAQDAVDPATEEKQSEPEKKADEKIDAKKADAKKGDKKSAKDLKEYLDGDVDVGGRVFYRVEADGARDDWSLDQEIASARVEVTWRWRFLRAVVEAELRGSLRDAYVRAKSGTFGVRAGNFKPPTSAIELESAFRLPMATRGVLNDVITEKMQIGGRRPGLQFEWSGLGPLAPRVWVGAFQPTDYENEVLVDVEPGQMNAAARASIVAGLFEIGVFGETVAGPAPDLERFWVGGADVTVDRIFGRQGVRFWADVQAGTHNFAIDPAENAFFVAARLIAAWRFGGIEETDFYVEPYLYGGMLDADDRFGDDLILEGVAGLNVGAWKRVRVALELALTRVDQPPTALEPFVDAPVLIDREMLRLFVAASF
jgi:hypothetical protein